MDHTTPFDRWLQAIPAGGDLVPARQRDALIVSHEALKAARLLCEDIFGQDFEPADVLAVARFVETTRQQLAENTEP